MPAMRLTLMMWLLAAMPFAVIPDARTTGDLLLIRPRVLGVHSRGILETKEARRSPVEFDGPERDTDSYEIELPAHYAAEEIPPPVNADYDFASYHSRTALQGHVLHYTRTLKIRQLSVPGNRADDLKKPYHVIFGDERRTAVFRKQ